MNILLTLDNDKMLILNNSMQALDTLVIKDQPINYRTSISICVELRTKLLQKAIKNRQKNKSFILKLSYHQGSALITYLKEYEIYFPGEFGSYESNAILQFKNELHPQLL